MLETRDASIIEARSKLDALLNEMANKNTGFSLSADDYVENKSDVWASTPSKRNNLPRTPRRKKKKDTCDEDYSINDSNQTSYVIKIFDRHVDLAKFNENTPIYVMMRDWMKNNANDSSENIRNLMNTNFPDKDVEDDKNIYVLPSAKQEAPLYPRSVSPSIQTTFVENILNVEEDIDKLRKENMLRWRNEKNRWREYSLQTQQCNLESLVILKNAFTPQLS
nr:protein lin-37 homolog [Hydra vulgaris]